MRNSKDAYETDIYYVTHTHNTMVTFKTIHRCSLIAQSPFNTKTHDEPMRKQIGRELLEFLECNSSRLVPARTSTGGRPT